MRWVARKDFVCCTMIRCGKHKNLFVCLSWRSNDTDGSMSLTGFWFISQWGASVSLKLSDGLPGSLIIITGFVFVHIMVWYYGIMVAVQDPSSIMKGPLFYQIQTLCLRPVVFRKSPLCDVTKGTATSLSPLPTTAWCSFNLWAWLSRFWGSSIKEPELKAKKEKEKEKLFGRKLKYCVYFLKIYIVFLILSIVRLIWKRTICLLCRRAVNKSRYFNPLIIS